MSQQRKKDPLITGIKNNKKGEERFLNNMN